jgi:hypothetical protein
MLKWRLGLPSSEVRSEFGCQPTHDLLYAATISQFHSVVNAIPKTGSEGAIRWITGRRAASHF